MATAVMSSPHNRYLLLEDTDKNVENRRKEEEDDVNNTKEEGENANLSNREVEGENVNEDLATTRVDVKTKSNKVKGNLVPPSREEEEANGSGSDTTTCDNIRPVISRIDLSPFSTKHNNKGKEREEEEEEVDGESSCCKEISSGGFFKVLKGTSEFASNLFSQHKKSPIRALAASSSSTSSGFLRSPPRRVRMEELGRNRRYENEFEEIAPIGYGGFGSVHKCKNRLDGQLYAIKKVFLLGNPEEKAAATTMGKGKRKGSIVRSRDVGPVYAAQQLREVKLLASFTDHPNIVRYYCSWVEYLPRQHATELCGICGQQILLNQMPEHLSRCEVLKEEEYKRKLEKKMAKQQRKEEGRKRKKKKKEMKKAKRRERLLSTIEEISTKRVTIDDFEILKRISAGAFGRVFLVREKATGNIYALKVIRKKDAIEKNNLGKIILERDLLVKADNPYVVTLYYSFQSDDNLYFVMEYLPGGDLGALLEHVGYLDEEYTRFYVAQIVLALEHLHSKGIVHRDIKPDNILIDKDGYLKLTDFGLSYEGMNRRTEHPLYESNLLRESRSNIRTQATMRFSLVGTPDYLAPEIILQTGHSFPSDWWALGVCLYEFLTGAPPFNAASPSLIFSKVVVRNITWPSDEFPISPEARDLIEKLLEIDPAKRLGANGTEEVKNHPFFNGVDWSGLQNTPPPFVPSLTDSRDTSYFTNRIRLGSSFDMTEQELTPIQEEELNESDEAVLAENVASPVNSPKTPKIEKAVSAEQCSSPLSPRVLNFSMINVNALRQRSSSSPLAREREKEKKKKPRKKRGTKREDKKGKRKSADPRLMDSSSEMSSSGRDDLSGNSSERSLFLGVSRLARSDFEKPEDGSSDSDEEKQEVIRRKRKSFQKSPEKDKRKSTSPPIARDSTTTSSSSRGGSLAGSLTITINGTDEESENFESGLYSNSSNASIISELLETLPCKDDADSTVTLYIQMELYESATLSDWLSSKHRVVDTDSNLFIFTQIVEGLDHIHQHGIIHRDLKPSNIFITESDVVKIGDFGLAIPKLPDQDDLAVALTSSQERRTDVGVGTMLYAAPEQLQAGIGYDEKADIFALGVILAEMYCPPFAIPMERICYLSKLREPNPVLPCHIADSFPDEAALIRSMLSLDPAKRPSTGEILENPLIQEKVIKRRHFSSSADSSARKAALRACVNCARKAALIEQLSAQLRERDDMVKELQNTIADLQGTVKRLKRREKRRKKKERD